MRSLEVCGAERAGGGHDDGAELGDGQHRLPQFDLIAEHQDDAIALADAEATQPRRHPVGAVGHLGEGDLLLAAVLFDDAQRRAVIA